MPLSFPPLKLETVMCSSCFHEFPSLRLERNSISFLYGGLTVATYAIGDVQGCMKSLLQLVDTIQFDPNRDRLWFVGDLVNRGPDSLAVLRYVKGLGSSAVTVLGNHDLHLLAVAAGITGLQKKDSFHEVLSAPDCQELLHWLRHQPLIHQEQGFLLVHAGLLPQWTISQAVTSGW